MIQIAQLQRGQLLTNAEVGSFGDQLKALQPSNFIVVQYSPQGAKIESGLACKPSRQAGDSEHMID